MEQFGTPTNTALFARLIVGLAIDFPLRGIPDEFAHFTTHVVTDGGRWR
jgi:hypothetical protein